MRARAAGGEKEKRSIGQLNQVAGLEDDGRVKKDGGGWWWYTSRMTGKGCDNACCYLTIFEDHKHHQTFLLFRVQLVLGRRGSAETHLPGGDCAALMMIIPVISLTKFLQRSTNKRSNAGLDRVGNHERLLQLQHEIEREFELIKMVTASSQLITIDNSFLTIAIKIKIKAFPKRVTFGF